MTGELETVEFHHVGHDGEGEGADGDEGLNNVTCEHMTSHGTISYARKVQGGQTNVSCTWCAMQYGFGSCIPVQTRISCRDYVMWCSVVHMWTGCIPDWRHTHTRTLEHRTSHIQWAYRHTPKMWFMVLETHRTC